MNNHRMGRAVALCLSLSGGMFAQIAAAQQARRLGTARGNHRDGGESAKAPCRRRRSASTAVSAGTFRIAGLTDLETWCNRFRAYRSAAAVPA